MKGMAYFFLFIFLVSYSYASTVHGSIYDLSLKKVNNVIVEIDTVPNQRYVAVNGSFSFEVPVGRYRIKTYYNDESLRMSAIENITIADDGIYILDLFLYPNLEDNEDLYGDIEFDIDEPQMNEGFSFAKYLLMIVGAVAVGLSIYLFKKRAPRKIVKVGSDIDKIIMLLKRNHGRMTQKELRKEFPLSEAKISLMVAELESLGKVKKIKQGRGNIIILEK
ncbi:MAG: hypothetical protein NDI94_02615 [Candidatus Woesearchaeota archaeon]|nr:hypothetical protein [Candidatus Woesearchaeota archaeon]